MRTTGFRCAKISFEMLEMKDLQRDSQPSPHPGLNGASASGLRLIAVDGAVPVGRAFIRVIPSLGRRCFEMGRRLYDALPAWRA